MPIYDYRCIDCKHEFELYNKLAQKDKQKCPKCKGITKTLITTTSRPDVFLDYYDENLDATVTSSAHRRQIMREKDVREVDMKPKRVERIYSHG